MASLAPSTDIKSVTLENGLLEIAHKLQSAEQATVVPEGQALPNRINVTYNTDANTATISATLPITVSIATDGKPQFLATEYAD